MKVEGYAAPPLDQVAEIILITNKRKQIGYSTLQLRYPQDLYSGSRLFDENENLTDTICIKI